MKCRKDCFIIWDHKNDQKLFTLTGHKYGVCEATWSPDGKQIAFSWNITGRSERKPKRCNAERIRSALPATSLGGSMFSIRTSQRPPRECASRKLATAATSEPKCRSPVGDGAKRPIGVITAVSGSTVR